MRFSIKKLIAIALMLIMVIELPGQVVAKGLENANSSNSITDVNNDFIKSAELTLSVQKPGEISAAGSANFYIFNCTESGKYSFYTTGDLDTVGYLYDGSQQQLSNNDDDYFDKNFCINYTLEAGKAYYIKVTAHSDKVTGKYTIIAEKSSDKIPDAPINITVTNKDYTSIAISWDKPSDDEKIKEYDIYRDEVKIANVFDNSYKDINLKPGTNYVYTIRACNMYGNYSEESAKYSVDTDKDTTAPDVVQGLNVRYSNIYYASDGYRGEVDLYWSPSKDNLMVEGYYVYRDDKKIGYTCGNNYKAAEYCDRDLQPNKEYTYTVKAYDAAGNVSDVSLPLKYTVDNSNREIDLNTAQSIDCYKEIDVNSTIDYQNMLFLFQPSQSGYYYVKIESTASHSDAIWFKDLSDIYNYYSGPEDIENLTAGEKYYFNFCAYNQGEYKVTVIGPDKEEPSKPNIVSTNYTYNGKVSININISDNLPHGITYDVYRNGVPIAKKQEYYTYYNCSYCTFIDNDIVAEGTYNYDIVAYDIAGNKSEKATVTVNVSGGNSTIKNLTAGDNTGSSIKLSWNNGCYVKGCKIYRNGIKIGESNSNNYTDTGLICGNKYTYAVKPYDVNGKLYDELTINVTAQADDYGNDFKTAISINIDNNITGQIDYYDDVDFLSLTVPETGNYAINFSGTTVCQLYDENQKFLNSTWNIKGCIRNVLYSGKTYYLKIANGTPGQYSLNFVKNIDSNIKSCKPTVYTTSINSRNVYFTACSDNPYIVGFNIYRNGAKIATVNDKYFHDDGLLPDNNYSYKIEGFDVDGNLSQQSDEVRVTTLSDDYGDDISSSAPLQLDNSITGIINCGDDKDFFNLTTKESGNYVISGDTNNYLKITILDKDGKEIKNYYYGSGDFTDTVINLDGNSNYYIRISNTYQTGGNFYPVNYKFSVSLRQDDYGDDTSTALSIQLDNNIKGIINFDCDKDFFSITPKQSGNYTINGQADNNIYITVLDNAGEQIRKFSASNDFSSFSAALTADNIYYIEISSNNPSTNYNFTVSLSTNIPVPDKLNAFSTGSHSNYICWGYSNTDNMNYAAGFKIFRDGKQIGDTKNYYYDDMGLNPGTNYIYTVKAYDNFGNMSELSSSCSADTWYGEYSHDYKNPSEIPLDTEINSNTYPVDYENYLNNKSNISFYSFSPSSEGEYQISYKWNSAKNGYLYIRVFDENNIPLGLKGSLAGYKDENGDPIYSQSYYQDGLWQSMLINKKLDAGKKYYIEILEINFNQGTVVEESFKTANNILRPSVDENDLNYTDSKYNFVVSKAQSAVKSFAVTTTDYKKADFRWDVLDNNNILGFVIYRDNAYYEDSDYNGIYIPSGSTREFEYDQYVYADNSYSILALFNDGRISQIYGSVGITAIDTVSPDKPDGMMLISRARNSISMAWTNSKDNCAVKGYAIYKNGQKFTELTGDELNKIYDERHGYFLFKDTFLMPNTQYTYTVRAFDYSGNYSEDSNPLTVTTCDDDYGDDYTSAYDITSALNSDSQIKGTINDTEDIDFFSFVPAQSGLYTFTSKGDTDLCGYLYDENQNILQCNDDINDKDANFYIQQRLEAGKKYYLKAAFQNGRGTGDYTLLTQLKDEIPPTVPQNIRITSLAGKSASICWDESSDNIAVTGYEIYRDDIKIGDTKDLTFKDTGLTQNQKYIYTVRAYDAGSNYSAESAKLEVTPSAPEITAVEPADKSVIGGEKTTIKICCDSYYDTSSAISIKYSTDGILWNSAEGSFSDSYNGQDGNLIIPYEWDLKSLNTGDYQIKIDITDSDGCSTEKIISYSVDRTPPANPEELTAETEFKAVKLEWKVSEDNNVSFYKIYRSDSANGAYSSIASVYGNNSLSYEDRSLEYNKNYYYKITAVDIFDQEGDFSNVSYAMASSDITPPTVPVNLRMDCVGGNSVKIQWDFSTDNMGVLGYEIYRDGTKAGQTNSSINYFTDKGLTTNSTYKYTIKAFDASGNYSDYSKELLVVPMLPDIKSITPDAGSIIGGKNADFQIYLKNMGDYSLAKVQAQYSTDCLTWKDADFKTSVFAETGTDEYSVYLNWNLQNLTSGNYSLKLKLCDSDGNVTEKVIPYVVDRTAPGIPSMFIAFSDYLAVQLKWRAPSDSDIKLYKIYRSDSADGIYTLVGTVNSSDKLTFKDSNLTGGSTYYYKITAVDNFDQEGNFSESASAAALVDDVKPLINAVSPKDNTIFGGLTSITVTAEDNYKLSCVTLQYHSDGSDTWNDIGTINTDEKNVSVNFKWDTSKLNGEVKVRAIAKDYFGNIGDDSPIRTYTIDTVPPAKVAGLTYTAFPTSIYLTWSDVPDNDLDHFEVFMRASDNGDFVKLGKVYNKVQFTASGLKPDSTYCFKIAAYDTQGNKGEDSDIMQVKTLSDNISPSIATLGPDNGYYTNLVPVTCEVKDNYRVRSLSLQLSNDRITWNEIANLKPDNSTSDYNFKYDFNVAGLSEGKYYLRAIADDTCGNRSDSAGAPPYISFNVDRTPPLVVRAFQIVPDMGYITIKWQQNFTDAIQCYNIYRATDANGPFKLQYCVSQIDEYIDYNVEKDTNYYYKITSVDLAGNEGPDSDIEQGMLLKDTEAPKIVNISPTEGIDLPKNPNIGAVVSDNYKVTEVKAEYCAEGSDIWNTIEDRSMNTRIDLAAFKWKTDGLGEGIYKFRYTVTDASGNITVSNEIKYKLNANAPGKPQATAEGIGKGVKITWTRPSDSDLGGYRILRSTSPDGSFGVINQTPEENYTDTKLKPGTTYYYKIEAVDKCYNAQDSDIVSAVPTYDDTQQPIAVCDEKKNCIITDSVTFDGSKSSDDSGIAEYSWDFGDGSGAQGAVVNHVYSQPGQYMAVLTVTDVAGKKSSCNCLVTIYSADGASYLQAQVVDDVTGEPLSGACIAIKLSDDTTEKYITDESGNVVIVEPLGQYDIYAYTDKYEPAHQVATVTSNLLNKTTIRLKKGDVVVGNITTHRMTIQEINDAGIDIKDPDNNYTYNVTIILNKNSGGAGQSFSYNVNSCGIILGVGGVSNNYYICDKNYVVPFAVPCKGHPEVAPATGCMIIPIEGKWLKEFFSIHLTLQNTASPEFYIDGGQVGLEIPDGLSLAPTKEQQHMASYFDKLAGGETKEFDWIVRGDTPGNYQVGAFFSGFLEPFGEPISANFVCSQQITVMGGTALSEWIRIDNTAQKGVPYNILVRLSNKSDFPEYNISMNLLEGEGYTIPASEKMLLPYTIDELPAHSGKTFKFFVIPQTDIFMMNYSNIQLQGSGQVPKTTIDIIPVKIRRKGFMGAIDRFLGDPIDSTSGSHEINKTLLTENGAVQLTFEAAYDSSLLEEGIMGKGWTTNYESFVERSTDGRLIAHWDSNHENAFEPESTSGPQDEKIYYAQDKQLQGEQLRINSDGTYKLMRKNGSTWYFNDKGYVTKITDKNGFSVLVGHDSSNKVHDVTEPVSGEKITYSYNDKGLLSSAVDSIGRTVRFSYDSNNCLTELTDANGNTTHYSYTEDGKVLSCTDSEGRRIFNDYYDENGRISKQDDGADGNQLTELTYKEDNESKTLTTTAKDRLGNTKVLVYDYDGNLLSEKDALGNTSTYTYDKNGSLLSKKDPSGNITKFAYDDNGNVTSITDPLGKVTTMQYDSNNNLISAKNNTGVQISTKYNGRNQLIEMTDQLNNKTAFEYDDNGLLIKKTSPNNAVTEYTYENGRIKTQKDADGVTKTYEYDTAGRVTAVYDKDNNKTSYEYDNCNNIKKITDALKNETEFGYDSHGNKIYEKDAKGNVTSYTYNGNLKLTDIKDALNNETKLGYDGEDNLTSITDAKGNILSYVYDQNGRLLQSENKEGKVTKYTYDADGNVMTETSPKDETTTYTYEKGILKSVKTANGGVTSYEYDDAGRLKAETDPLNNRTEYEYDNADELISVTDALGHKISYTYDENHNRITQKDANGNVTAYGYSPAGRMTSIKDASGSETHYEYDGQGRLLKTTAPDGAVCSIAYDELGRVISITDPMQNTTKMEYDALGNLTVQKDAYDKQIITTEYDALGRATKQTDALSRTVQYKYDNVGNLIQTVNPAGQTSTVDYDKLGRTVKAVDALNGSTSETYDDDGRVETLKDPNNNEVKYTYDSVGNLIQEDYSSGRKLNYQYDLDNQLKQITNGRQQNISMTYDAVGRNTTMVTPEDTVNMNYDSNGNLLEEKDSKGTIRREYDSLNRVKKYTDANGNTIGYSYDNVGNLTALTYPDGKTVNYQYNLDNQLTCVTDWNGRKTTYDYDKNGRLTKTERPDGSAETKSYDDAGQVLTSADKDKNGNTINSFSYKYDQNGNVISEENAKDNQNPSFSQPLINTESKMTYGSDNRLLTFNNVNAEYDADGNMTSGPISSEIITGDGTSTTSFKYDSQNRLIQAGNTAYSYDAEGNRISVNEKGKATSYIVNPQSGLSQVLVKTGIDGRKTYYVYGLGLISEETEGGKYLLHHYDRRGSTIALTDINGAIIDTFKYASYGELVSRTGSADTPFLFCGLYGVMTDNNGLYYMRARYYNPIIKRFMNADVVTGNVVDSGSMNRYAYVNGNPVSYIDPFGLCADTDRVDSGLKKIISGFIGVVIAAAVVVGAIFTGGALLAVIAVVAANVGIGAYCLADIDEGNQDVIYGAAGADDKSRNFMLDTVFAGNKTAYMIGLIALTALDWAGAKMLAAPGSAGEIASDINEGSKTIENSSEVVDISIDEAAADSEKMLEESGSRLALPEPEKLLELPAPEAVAEADNLPILHSDQVIINNYQRYYREAWSRVVNDFNKGNITIPAEMNWKTVLGQRTDAIARNRLINFLRREGIPEGPQTEVLVNRWLRDPSGSGKYRIPDVRLKTTGTILDGTIGNKTMTSPQIQDFIQFSGGNDVVIVKP